MVKSLAIETTEQATSQVESTDIDSSTFLVGMQEMAAGFAFEDFACSVINYSFLSSFIGHCSQCWCYHLSLQKVS